ncbi:hypothetical protein V6U78_09125 [Marinospirillum sp. MEB164]|uniref:Uncharacterized protein n=1 Tax=Marinospirillum alkalitolerans TaxID=3123374 RepID=A0ABW8PY66_9GAMM
MKLDISPSYLTLLAAALNETVMARRAALSRASSVSAEDEESLLSLEICQGWLEEEYTQLAQQQPQLLPWSQLVSAPLQQAKTAEAAAPSTTSSVTAATLPLQVTSAAGISGVLCRDFDGEYFFRVEQADYTFTDYLLLHDDLPVTIDPQALASFYIYQDQEQPILDHSPEVLGLALSPRSDV